MVEEKSRKNITLSSRAKELDFSSVVVHVTNVKYNINNVVGKSNRAIHGHK